MTARATVSPPTPESKIPMGASRSGTAWSLGSEGSRAPAPVCPGHQQRAQQARERAEQVALPRHLRRAGEDAEQHAAPDREQHDGQRDLAEAAGEEPAREQEDQPAE